MVKIENVDGGLIINFSSGFEYDYIGIFALSFKELIHRDTLFNYVKSLEGPFKIQFLNVNSIASWRHVASAAMRALRSFKYGQNISDKIEIELLLYCSGKRQIKDALNIVGLSEFIDSVVLVIFGSSNHLIHKVLNDFLSVFKAELSFDLLINLSMDRIENLMKIFNVDKNELDSIIKSGLSVDKALEYILIERGSALEVYK
ncbi:MAG: KEOPS complex subunit Cgi121 [Candidatus Methanomethylicia archaeon]